LGARILDLWPDPFQRAVKQLPPFFIFELLKNSLPEKFARGWYRCGGGGKQRADVDLGFGAQQ